MIGMTSSIVSPATKRVVSFLKNLKVVAKSLSPSCRDNQISALLVIMCGPSLCYPWRRLSPTNSRRNICTPASKQGSLLNAIEARNSRFTARGNCGCRFVYRTRVGCLLREGSVKSRPACGFDSSAARRGNHLRINLCLPSYCAPPKAAGVSDCYDRYTAHTSAICVSLNFEFAVESEAAGAG